MSVTGQRLKKRRKEVSMSADDVASELGVSRSTIFRYESGYIEKVPANVLEKLAIILHTTPAYLMGWDDDPIDYEQIANDEGICVPNDVNVSLQDWVKMKKATHDDHWDEEQVRYDLENDKQLKEISMAYLAFTPTGREKAHTYIMDLAEQPKYIDQNRKNIVSIVSAEFELNPNKPVTRFYTYLNKIACAGFGFYFDDIPTDMIEAPCLTGADFIIGVNGASMEPTFHDGDKVYVEKTCDIDIGDIGIFTLDNTFYIKELGHEELISYNEDYPNIPARDDIRIVGKVLGKVE